MHTNTYTYMHSQIHTHRFVFSAYDMYVSIDACMHTYIHTHLYSASRFRVGLVQHLKQREIFPRKNDSVGRHLDCPLEVTLTISTVQDLCVYVCVCKYIYIYIYIYIYLYYVYIYIYIYMFV